MYRNAYRTSIIFPYRYSNLSVSRNYSLIRNNIVSQRIKPLGCQGHNNIYLPILSTYREKHIRRDIHSQSGLYKDAESKVDMTSKLLKDKIISRKAEDSAEKSLQAPGEAKVNVPRPTLWQKIVKELKHYYNGFKLLFLETKICYRLLKMVLNGHTLTRRERKQFTRTSADLFRLVPFSLFLIIPFMEFALPIFLKLFPNMLPSTFSEASKEKEAMRKTLVVKLEMAKFLQDTLEETAMKGSKSSKEVDPLGQNFSEFMAKIRSTAEQPTNEDIIKYSSLFENELTLDNLSRQQLIALCQILEVSTLGNIPPNHILRFQLRMRVRSLEADDKLILKEGIEKLDIKELQLACRERGMRAMGLSKDRLKTQLEQWLELHIKQNIPVSLLLFSRSLYLPDNLPKEDLISKTLSALPKSIEDATVFKIAEMSGSKVDNTKKLELLKQEEAQIELENQEHDQEEKKSKESKKISTEQPVPAKKPEVVEPVQTLDLNETIKAETAKTEDKPEKPVEETLTVKDIKNISQIIENLPSNISVKNVISEEISDLKKDIQEYIEDVKEVQELSNKESRLKETRSAKILSNRVQKLVKEMDSLVEKIELDKKDEVKSLVEALPIEVLPSDKNRISVDSLVEAISQLKTISDEKRKILFEILKTVDTDNDGNIDDLSDVIKVFDIIEQENVMITKQQLAKLVNILNKEKEIEEDEEKIKKQETTAKTTTTPTGEKPSNKYQ